MRAKPLGDNALAAELAGVREEDAAVALCPLRAASSSSRVKPGGKAEGSRSVAINVNV
jgi:hypothetical protein